MNEFIHLRIKYASKFGSFRVGVGFEHPKVSSKELLVHKPNITLEHLSEALH